ncbi:DUF2795 domain-containing protein [Streptomyces sp. MST-110588]|uniref:DUF2795 domain-containing protein n=1 Tax=Streptomyces sp. MST-110588 TaxID=2833628 RepID=UPI001F5CAFCC|nr:DUF2795 domain-containing protein [Streptomyces sp. MST-110588]UNO39228.1 DUF2795 domain-containing protein [Streptomyces sp. MST-110588]
MQRRSDRMSARRDDEMKHELKGLLRSGHSTRVEEWHDPEPAAADDPRVAAGPVPRPGPWGEMELLRFELARHLGRSRFPARRRALVRELLERRAPDQLVEAVRALPAEGSYRNVQEVVSALLRDGSA